MPSPANNLTQHPCQRPLWSATLLALLLLLTTTPGMAAVRATLDRNTVYMGDIFVLTIERDGQSSVQQPDLAPLEKDFDVLGSNTSTQVLFLNGRRSDKIQWRIQLQARRPGQLQIPAVSIDGQQTDIIALKVIEPPELTAAQISQHAFIEIMTGTGNKPVYVQQQIPYTVRLHYNNRLRNGELSTPGPKNAVVEQLGKEKHYNTIRKGRQYRVIERNYVISAEKSGELTIPPIIFRGRIATGQQDQRTSRPRNPMEAFFGNNPFGDPGQPVTIRSESIDMQIWPRPETAGHNWLPAETITLSDSWTETPPQFRVGEPVSRTVTLQARGLSGSQTPELTINTPVGSRVYPETSTAESHTDGSTIYGVRTRTLTYIPGTQGTLNVPAITLDWWDTRQNKPASTTLPALQFTVRPGSPGDIGETQVTTTPSANSSTDDSEVAETDQHWQVIGGGVLFTLILLLAIQVWRTKRRRSGTASASKESRSPDRKSALRNLQKACATNDRQAAVRALLNLAQSDWPNDPPRSLAALAARIEKGQKQLRELERSLYAVDTVNWDSTLLWNDFRHGLRRKETTEKHHDGVLKPLYPDGLRDGTSQIHT